MLATPSGITTIVRLEHSEKAEFPMLVTVVGIVMLVNLLQQENA